MSLISAEISLSPAEIAYEPNDGHLEIIKKVIKIICRNNFKECFEFNLAVLRHYWVEYTLFCKMVLGKSARHFLKIFVIRFLKNI